MVNSMFAVRQDSKKLPDENCKVDYNYYASGTQQSEVPQHITNGTVTAYDGFKTGVSNIIIGANDRVGTTPGNNDPMFENFPFNTNPLLSYDNFNTSWDFHLKTGSPALNGAKTDINPYFATLGLTLNGKEYKSPLPAAYFGAHGSK